MLKKAVVELARPTSHLKEILWMVACAILGFFVIALPGLGFIRSIQIDEPVRTVALILLGAMSYWVILVAVTAARYRYFSGDGAQ